jgi:SpoU rRNA methylase family enzyme
MVDNDPVIYYANALNGPAVLREVILKYSGKEILQDLRLIVEVTSVGESISYPFIQRISTLLDEVNVPLRMHWNAGNLMKLIESQPGEINVTIKADDEVIHEQVFEIKVASPAHWSRHSDNSLTSLAAFVQPNHPSLLPVLDKAASLLKERNHSVAFSGFQDPSHVPHMVEALWDAVQSFDLVYSDPPASWDDYGQKIRNAQQVLEAKYATCLDTTILFASLLENIGLVPIIALAPGHAWVGYWMVDAEIEGTPVKKTVNQLSDVILYADLEDPLLVFLESTKLCVEGEPVPFALSRSLGMSNVALKALGQDAQYANLIDIYNARSFRGTDRVVPMPARFEKQDGTVEVHEYKPAEFTYNMLIDRLSVELKDKGRSANLLNTSVPPRLKVWLDSLLDLTLRNPLINFRNPRTSVQLIMAPGLISSLEDMISAGEVFSLAAYSMERFGGRDVMDKRGQAALPVLDRGVDELADALRQKVVITRFPAIDELALRLRRMLSQAKSILDETGSNGLYLALGELVWEPKGSKTEVRSPLFLVPITLTAKNRSQEFYIQLDESSQITPNYSLVQKFKVDYQIDLSMLAELETDDSGINVPKTINALREKLVEAKLNGFRVDETATLGFFNFSSYRLWRDLIENWKTFEKNPLVNHLIYSPNVPFEDKVSAAEEIDLDALVAKLPIEADSSQAQAVAMALQGKTFVLQGPPGTGKSQTITNLLARSLHEGKRVLFVAEKKDALDVVKDRLNKVGLGAFSLDLHDKLMSPKFVKQQLLEAVNQSTKSDVVGFDASLNSYDQSVRPLVDYRAKLHETGELGESIYSAIDQYLALPGDAEFEVSGEFIANATAEIRDEVRDDFATIANIGTPAGTAATNDWFVSTLTEQPEELRQIISNKVNLLAELFGKVQADAVLAEYLRSVESRDEFEASAVVGLPNLSAIDPAPALGEAQKVARRNALESLGALLAELENVKHDLRNLRLINTELELGQVVQAQAASFITRGPKLNAIAKRINIALGFEFVADKETVRADVETLGRIASAERAALADLARVNGLRVLPDENLLVSGAAAEIRQNLENLEKLTTFAGISRSGEANPAKLIADAAANPSKYENYVTFIEEVGYLFNMVAATDETLERWQRGEPFGARLGTSLTAWITDSKEHSLVQLGRVITLNGLFAKLRARGLGAPVEQLITGKLGYIDAENAFAKGYFKALANNLMVKQGFNTFDGAANGNFITKLKGAKGQLQDQLPKILAAELGRRRGFDASAKLGAVGDLILSLNAKRSVPIRTMLARHWDVISKLSPCVLASPDSTVRFLGADFAPFDLVVFDEASQIKVANAIGALGRGAASIIVGDRQQMPPTAVAQSKNSAESPDVTNEDEEEIQGADAESILDQCRNARVPDVFLNWHYRSEDESLIAFSNINYYEGRLNSFPNPSSERESKGLSFVRVQDGQFIRPGDKIPGARGTNPKEAEAIIAEVARRAKDPVLKHHSLGIVTFNQAQQALIEDLLFTSTNKAVQDAVENGLGGETILVKNLETVQGSERDVILFSIAFSRSPGGKQLSINFGPLNNSGGERRLNVAITRAKKQVIVFCSFEPGELKNRGSDSLGLNDLASYLALASKGAESQVLGVVSELDTDRHRSRVLAALTNAGLTAVEDMGLSGFKVDIALYDPKDKTKAVMGILLDGPRWNSRNTVNDRDLLPVAVLENKMGWPLVERLWLPAWLRDEAGEIERIKAAFERAKTIKPNEQRISSGFAERMSDMSGMRVLRDGEWIPMADLAKAKKEAPAEPQPAEQSDGDPLSDQLAGLPRFTHSPVMPTGSQSDLDDLNNRAVQVAIRDLAADVTALEGPVSPARLASFVGAAFGYSRVTAKRAQGILSVGFVGHATDQEGFIYPRGVDPNSFSEFKVGQGRHPDEIALPELANIMNKICELGQGCREEQLTKVTAQTLGITRLTTQLQTRLNLAIALGISTGRLARQGEYLTAN